MQPEQQFLGDLERLRRWPMRTIVASPSSFDGTLSGLYTRHIAACLPRPATVAYYHRLLSDYCQRDNPLFVVRKVTGVDRGKEYKTRGGHRFIPSDNSPAWWMHFLLFNDILIEPEVFARSIHLIPTHIFEVKRRVPATINDAGWYVAHIFAVKNRNIDHWNWDRSNLVRRFIRNIHPCNQFYVPLTKGQQYGEDQRVIAYFAARYRERYGEVWQDFLRLAQAEDFPRENNWSHLAYSFVITDKVKPILPAHAVHTAGHDSPAISDIPAATYRHSRLCFKKSVIESLRPDEAFRVVTNNGTFQMTRDEFEQHFPNVVASESYRRGGVYNYKQTPAKADQFRVE